MPTNVEEPQKRGYSREFTPEPGREHRYLLDGIPVDLWEAAKRRADAEGVSMRALILQLLKEYAA